MIGITPQGEHRQVRDLRPDECAGCVLGHMGCSRGAVDGRSLDQVCADEDVRHKRCTRAEADAALALVALDRPPHVFEGSRSFHGWLTMAKAQLKEAPDA